MSGDHDAVFLQHEWFYKHTKVNIKVLRRGFELLKKKADALKARIQKMIRAIHNLKLSIGEDVKLAHLALAKACTLLAAEVLSRGYWKIKAPSDYPH